MLVFRALMLRKTHQFLMLCLNGIPVLIVPIHALLYKVLTGICIILMVQGSLIGH